MIDAQTMCVVTNMIHEIGLFYNAYFQLVGLYSWPNILHFYISINKYGGTIRSHTLYIKIECDNKTSIYIYKYKV